MKILKKYKKPNARWFETTVKECIDHTEGGNYWKLGTVINLLKSGISVCTPFAVYKLKGEEMETNGGVAVSIIDTKKRYMEICKLLQVNIDAPDKIQIRFFIELKEFYFENLHGIKLNSLTKR